MRNHAAAWWEGAFRARMDVSVILALSWGVDYFQNCEVSEAFAGSVESKTRYGQHVGVELVPCVLWDLLDFLNHSSHCSMLISEQQSGTLAPMVKAVDIFLVKILKQASLRLKTAISWLKFVWVAPIILATHRFKLSVGETRFEFWGLPVNNNGAGSIKWHFADSFSNIS